MGGSNIYAGNTTIKAPWDITYDADGKAWMYAIAHTTLVANTPYLIKADEFGPITGATTATHGGYIGVPDKAGTSGAKVRLQVGGRVTAMITPSLSISVGHACSIASSVVADTGADYIGAAAEFAVCKTASTTSTTQDVILVPKFVTCG
jgi:hypothetical protein